MNSTPYLGFEKINSNRKIKGLILAIAMSTLLLLGSAPAVEAATPKGTVIPSQGVNIRSGPGTGYKVVRTAKKGASLGLKCYATGTPQKGIYGTSNIWYLLVDGGYVADAFIYTGTNRAVTGKCGSKPAAPPSASGVSKKTDSFVAKHKNKAWDYDGRWGAQCVDLFNYFNRDVVKAGFVPVTFAHQLYSAAPASKYQKLGPKVTPRKGDIAIYNKNVSRGNTGHVAIVLKVVNGSTLQVIDQNWVSPKATIHNIGKGHLTGYLRPKV